MAGTLARAIEGVPVVADASERDALFPAPARDQRVQLRSTGDIQRYDGVAWTTAYRSPAIVNSGSELATKLALGSRTLVPIGGYSTGTAVTMENGQILEGEGFYSQITYSGASTFLTVGESRSVLNGKGRISDLCFILSNIASTAIALISTYGTALRDLYIEGPTGTIDGSGNFTPFVPAQYAARTNTGVFIDGAEASSFYNTLDAVTTNHCHVGFRVGTTGSVRATQQTFINCSAFGDYKVSGVLSDATSIGFKVDNGQGDGTLIVGGNVENCGTGMYIDGYDVTVTGVRFEIDAAATAIHFGPNARNCFVTACSGLLRAQIVDDSPAGSNNIVIIPGETQVRWTAAMAAGTSGTITLTAGAGGSLCYYERTGKTVRVWGKLAVTSVSAPVGPLYVTSLPFAVANDAGNYAPVTVRATGLTAGATTTLQGYAEPNTSRLVLEQYAAGAAGDLASRMQAGSVVLFSCTYITT